MPIPSGGSTYLVKLIFSREGQGGMSAYGPLQTKIEFLLCGVLRTSLLAGIERQITGWCKTAYSAMQKSTSVSAKADRLPLWVICTYQIDIVDIAASTQSRRLTRAQVRNPKF